MKRSMKRQKQAPPAADQSIDPARVLRLLLMAALLLALVVILVPSGRLNLTDSLKEAAKLLDTG